MLNARYEGVVRSPVVRSARSGQRGRMLRVVPLKARYAGVIPFWRDGD
jgi:hypothetical protein